MSLLIMDLSRGEWDPTHPKTKVDFAKAKAAGIVACYFRDANGKYNDATAPTFEQDASAAGLPWGDFLTLYPPSAGMGTIQQQTEKFIVNAATVVVGNMPLVVDWEVEGVTWNMAYQAIALIQAAFPGKEIIIYSRAEYLARMLPNKYLQAASYKWFQQFAIWQAAYGFVTPPALPSGFTRVLWQFTDRADASLYGINPLEAKGVDMSYFDGTIDQFNTRFGLLPVPPITTDPVIMPTLTVNGVTVSTTLTFHADQTVTGTWRPA